MPTVGLAATQRYSSESPSSLSERVIDLLTCRTISPSSRTYSTDSVVLERDILLSTVLFRVIFVTVEKKMAGGGMPVAEHSMVMSSVSFTVKVELAGGAMITGITSVCVCVCVCVCVLKHNVAYSVQMCVCTIYDESG